MRKEIAALLFFAVAAIVLLAFLQAPQKNDAEESPVTTVSLKPELFQEALIAVLHEFGLGENALVEANQKTAKKNKVAKLYTVQLPAEVPIPFLLRELQEKLPGVKNLLPREKSINGDASIDIVDEQKNLIRYEFTIRPDIQRNTGSLCLLITDIEELPQEEFQAFMEYSTQAGFLVTASDKGKAAASKIVHNEKEYVVAITDQTDEADYKLREDFPLNRLNSAITNIINGFPSALLYVVDTKSHVFNSSVFQLLEQKLKKKNKKLVKQQQFTTLPEQGDYSQTLAYLLNKAAGQTQAPVLLVTSQQYKSMESSIRLFIKRGGKLKKLSEAGVL